MRPGQSGGDSLQCESCCEIGKGVQAESLKKELGERLHQKVVDAQKAGQPLQPRWFELKSPDCLTLSLASGTEQRYRSNCPASDPDNQ